MSTERELDDRRLPATGQNDACVLPAALRGRLLARVHRSRLAHRDIVTIRDRHLPWQAVTRACGCAG